MSAITTITLVATIAINIFIIRFTVFTTPDVALAVILLLCPTFVAWSLILDLNFHSHFLHFALCFGTDRLFSRFESFLFIVERGEVGA